MTRRFYARATAIAAASFAISFSVIAATDPLPRIVWNASASAPIGLYRIQPDRDPPLGTLVAVAPPQRLGRWMAVRGYLGENVPLLKHVGIPEAWIWAVMRVESAGNARAVSRAGAMGLMQIMPGTWAQLRARHGLGTDPFDVRDNIMAGAAYLREMHDRYGNASAMLAAYNAGPGRYGDYLSRGRPLPPETIGYLAQLAPISSTSGAAEVAVSAPPDPFAWRRAALFVRTASAAPEATSVQSDDEEPASELPTDRPRSSDVRAVALPASEPADTLFVPRASAGRPQ